MTIKADGAVTPLGAKRENDNLLIYDGRAVRQSNRSDTTSVLTLDTSLMFMS